MTITSSRYLEPISRSKTVLERNDVKPPPRLWPSVEAPFKGYHAAPSEGYKQSSSDTAIVIDNGPYKSTDCIRSNLLIHKQELALCERDGPLTKLLECHSLRMWLVTGIAKSIGRCHTSDMMLSPMLPHVDRFEMLSNPEAVLSVIGTWWKEY